MIFRWSEEKNALLKRERGVGFEDVVLAFEAKRIIDTITHPSPKYRHQEMLIVEMKGYVYAVPFVQEADGSYFLKTIYPSRKLMKRYKGEDDETDRDR
ncbi:toxin [Hydrogenimonas sp.]